MPMTNVEVQWEIAADSKFANDRPARYGARASRAWPQRARRGRRVSKPGRDYWYRFRAGGEVSQTGRTRTAPAAGAQSDRLRFAVCGCSHYEAGYFTAYRHIADEHFDFIFHTRRLHLRRAGGWRPQPRRRAPASRQRNLLQSSTTATDTRMYKSDPDLMAAHASAPFIVTFDDHEVDNDYAGDQDEQGTPPELFLLRRAAAYQAYYETMPLRRRDVPDGQQHAAVPPIAVRQSDRPQHPRHAAVPLEAGVRRRVEARCPSHWIPGGRSSAPSRRSGCSRTCRRRRARGRCSDSRCRRLRATCELSNPAARFSMDKWDGYVGARNRLYARLKESRAPNPDRAVGRRPPALRQRPQARLREARFRDDRRGIHQHLDHLGRRRRGRFGVLGATRADNPHMKYHSARARLHRVHRHAGGRCARTSRLSTG